MNELLEIYIASLDYPNVSGAEHLELLDTANFTSSCHSNNNE